MTYPIQGSAKFGKRVHRTIEALRMRALIVKWLNPPISYSDGQVLMDCAQLMEEMYAEIIRLRRLVNDKTSRSQT
jgi:hypothetical protein